MAKKKNVKTLLPVIIVAGAAILALIMALILTGITKTYENTTAVDTVSLVGMIFGGGPEVSTFGSMSTSSGYQGGMSIFGLISFIVLLLGIASLVASVFVEDKKLDLLGAALIALAGILMLLLLSAGTDIVKEVTSNMTVTTTFAEAFEGYSLAAGPIVYAIIAILGGGFGVANYFLKIVK